MEIWKNRLVDGIRACFLSVVWLTLLFFAGCRRTPDGGGEELRNIIVDNVQVTSGEAILLQGQSRLPQDTCIQTELYAGQKLQSWWPLELCGYVKDGRWQISVPLKTDIYSIELSTDVEYQVVARQQDKPEIESPIFVFDLTPPPE